MSTGGNSSNTKKPNPNAKPYVPTSKGVSPQNQAKAALAKGNKPPVRRQKKKVAQKPKPVDAKLAVPKSSGVGNSLKVDPINVQFDIGVLSGVSIEYVSRALQNGFATFTDNPNNAYGAANWIYRTLQNAISGTTSQIQSGPLWLVELCKCIASKEVRLGNGMVSYKPVTNVNTQVDLVPELPIGPTPYGYRYVFTVPDSVATPIDGFTVAAIATLPGDIGEAAWQQLVIFNQSSGINQEASVQFSTKLSQAEKSVSIFGTNFDRRGGGQGTAGGYFYLCGSETPVYQPILTCLGASGIDNNVPMGDRTALFPRRASGDSLYMTNFISQFSMSAWQNDRQCHFKSIDFLEFGTVLSTWAAQLVTEYFKDTQNLVTFNPAFTDATFQCPITQQEFLLLLRNEMMMMFKGSQTAVQGLYPLTPTSLSDNQFVAFLSASNTCPISNTGMKLPLSIVENMRALTWRYYKYGGKTRQAEIWCPILGQYVNDLLDPSDYQFVSVIGDVSHTVNVFSTNPPVQVKSFNKKGEETWDMVVEAPIDYVDGHCASANAYIYINGTTRLNQLATLWNEWVTRFDKYSDPLICVGTEAGPAALESISFTRHWEIPPAQEQKREKLFRDPRLKIASLMATPYDPRITVVDTSQAPLIAPLYESIQSTWILPTNKFQQGTQPNNRSTLQQYEAQFSELHSKVRSADGEGALTLASLHSLYALKMTKSSTSLPNDWVEAFTTASRSGEGGLISGLIAHFAGAAFGSDVGNVANAVADMLPF